MGKWAEAATNFSSSFVISCFRDEKSLKPLAVFVESPVPIWICFVISTKTAAESPVRKGGGEWRGVFVGVQGACPRGF